MLVKLPTLTNQQGSSLHCALAECAEEETGKNYANCAVKTATSQGMEDKQAKTPWEVRQEIVGDISHLKPSKNPELLIAAREAVPRTTSVTESGSEQEEVSGSRVVKEGSEQNDAGLSELQQAGWSQVQEEVVEDVLGVDRTELRPTNTQELLSGPKLAKKELEAKVWHKEVASFDRTGMNVTEGEEEDVLPGHSNAHLERASIKLFGGN